MAKDLRCSLIQSWPWRRGRGVLARALFPRGTSGRATFKFSFGTFVDAPIDPWPAGYRDLFLFNEFESDQVRLWKLLLKPGDVVVDGGANLGFWSLVASRLVGPDGLVVAFEPHPATVEELRRNLSASAATNVIAQNCGLWHSAAFAAMDNGDQMASRCVAQVRVQATSSGVALMDLDGFRPSQRQLSGRRIALIKLDVEGSEWGALQGMQRTIERDHPILTIEWNWETSERFGFVPSDVREFLAKYGYRAYSTDDGALVPFVEPRHQQSPMVWYVHAEHFECCKV